MPSDEQTAILEFPLTGGQNEGTDRAVLPPPQLSYLQNARYRKTQRLGKRNGFDAVTALNTDGIALGNGNGRIACLGPSFCVVDDVFYRRDTVHDTWPAKPSIGVLGGTRYLWNQFPQFTPGPIIDPPVQESLEINGAPAPFSGMTTGLGFIWTAEGRIYNGAWYICTNAIDPTTGEVVFKQDILLAGVATTDTPSVQLLSMPTPATIVMLTDGFTAGVKTSVQFSTLIDLSDGFSSPTSFTCIESAANYYPTSLTKILFTYVLTGSATTVRVGTLDPNTGTVAPLVTIGGAGNKTLLSIFGQAAGGVCVGYFDAAAVRFATFNAAFALAGTASITASIPTATGPVMFAERSAVSAYQLAAVVRGASNDTYVLDFSSVGAVTTVVMRQRNCLPLSQPFSIGTTQLFMWLRYRSGEGLGVASLVRIPYDQEYSGGASSLPGVFPIQATVDDRDVAAPLTELPAGVTLHSGPPFSTPRLASNGYNALINYTRSSFVSGSTTRYMRSVMLVPVRHLSEGLRYAPSCVVQLSDRQFVAGAQPMWVDPASAYEAGFIQSPVSIANPTQAGGGALTAVGVYSYTAVFESELGTVIERSAPAVPVTVTLTGVNNAITTRWTTMELGAHRQVTCKVYRTSANGSQFYFLNKFDASPGAATLGYFDFVDGYADSDIIQNESIYVQVGQELAADNFPACSFATTGNARLLCAGGFHGNVGHFSKSFTPHIAPEFADDDSFRVTLPDDWTGAAYCDAWVAFTRHDIWTISGDGPDSSGTGFFSPASRLPYAIGCIDWRSVAVADVGVFFQSARGLELLPRGFGQIQLMDMVQDTLETYPIITSARVFFSSVDGTQVIKWTCVTSEAATSGAIIVYDMTYKAFSVDIFGTAPTAFVFQSEWEGEPVMAPMLTTGSVGNGPFRVQNTVYADDGAAIEIKLRTGDVRPWGTFGHGVIHRAGMLGTLRSACSLNASKTTDRGAKVATPRVYTGVAPDYVVGDTLYLGVELGSQEQKDVTSVRLEFSESSAVEGVDFVGLIIEHDADRAQTFRLPQLADRIG